MAFANIKFSTGTWAELVFLDHAGDAWSWGRNDSGQLGQNSTAIIRVPTALAKLGAEQWVRFSQDQNWSAAITAAGKLYTCGVNSANRLGYTFTGSKLVFTSVDASVDWAHVICGAMSGYGLKTTGELYVWGSNSQGQLGLGDTTQRDTPTLNTAVTVSKFSAGYFNFAVIGTNGKLYTCGYSGEGALGRTGSQTSLLEVNADTDWSSVSVGAAHTLAIKTNGTLWGWGNGSNGRIGTNDELYKLSPVQIGVATDWAEAYACVTHSYARKTNGTIWSCGDNSNKQLILGASDVTQRLVFTQIGVGTNWTRIYACGKNLFAVDDTAKTVYVGGTNAYGEHGMNDTVERGVLTLFDTSWLVLNPTEDILDMASAGMNLTPGGLKEYADSASASEALVDLFAARLGDGIHATTIMGSMSNTTAALTDSTTLTDIIRQVVNQIVADTADGADTLNLGAALTLVDIANAVATQTSTYNSVMLVAELVATLEAFNGADSADIVEAGVLSDAYAARVAALVALLESAQAIDTNTTLVHVMQSATDSAEGATAITSTGSLISALLSDTALTTIRLNIGGELFTGWVLNTDTMAPSEYQFADRQFNSACKHGDTYLMAAEDGIYEFTEDTGVESVMTYIKTGKSDFGSDLKKRIVNSYIVYSATGNMVLKVTTSEYGQLQTRNYRLVPPRNSETTDVRRVDIGRGIKSRYWQFELVGDGVDCDIDEIGMLPIVLSRRI